MYNRILVLIELNTAMQNYVFFSKKTACETADLQMLLSIYLFVHGVIVVVAITTITNIIFKDSFIYLT